MLTHIMDLSKELVVVRERELYGGKLCQMKLEKTDVYVRNSVLRTGVLAALEWL